MEILSNYSILDAEYEVLKNFVARPAGENKSRAVIAGERIKFDSEKTSPADVLGYCRLGRIKLADFPDLTRYKARRDFSFRVEGKKLETIKRGEVCEIRGCDAWPLLLNGSVEPADLAGWSPARLNPPKTKIRQHQN